MCRHLFLFSLFLFTFLLFPPASVLGYVAQTTLRTNISSDKLYKEACTAVVDPSVDYVGLIAGLTSNHQLVCFKPGTYTHEVLIQNKQNLTLLAPEEGVTIQTTTLKTSLPQAPLDIRNSSNIFISGFKFINQHTFTGTTADTQWSNGIYINESNNVTFSNIKVQGNGKNSIFAGSSSNIQFLNTSTSCWYFCVAAWGTTSLRSDVYFKDSEFTANSGIPNEDHTMFWTAWSNWLFEDTTFNQINAWGFISGGASDSDKNDLTVRGTTLTGTLSAWIARHENYYALNVYLQGQYPAGIEDFITYGCWEGDDCSDYPNSIAYRFHVYRIPSANRPTAGQVDLVTNAAISGWALDPDIPAQSIVVQLIFDGPPGMGTLANVPTNVYRSDINQTMGISGNHGFSFQVPEQYKDCKPHVFYAYAAGDSSPNTQVRLSPGIYYFCPQTTPTPTPASTPTPSPLVKHNIFAFNNLIPNLGKSGSFSADLDGSGKVDISDYNLLVSDFSKTGMSGFIPADINKDGKVDIFDYNILINNFE